MKFKFSLVAVIAVMALVGAGCSNTTADNASTKGNSKKVVDSNAAPQDKLEGTWKITEATGQYASLNKGTLYTFEGKKKFTTKKGLTVMNGDITEMTDSAFTVMFEGMKNPFNYDYSFEGDKLVVKVKSSGGQVFTLERQ